MENIFLCLLSNMTDKIALKLHVLIIDLMYCKPAFICDDFISQFTNVCDQALPGTAI